jgi:uncharacterized protein
VIPISTTFRYTHPLGARAPYFEGLKEGRAIASRCAVCGRRSFPPQHCCGTGFVWEELVGNGTIVVSSDGFALIAMDGANNLTLGALRQPVSPGGRVRIAAAPGPVDHPSQAVFFHVVTGRCIASE